MKNLKILPYKMGSQSASALASHFGVKKIFPDRSYKTKYDDLIINWGCHTAPILDRNNCKVLNSLKSVAIASNKISTLVELEKSKVLAVEFTLSREEALAWITAGNIVYCRTLTRASEGDGIVVATKPEELVNAPLYTKYFKNKYEYRVHVFNGEVIDITQKRKMSEERLAGNEIAVENTSNYIRNHMKGWVFTRIDMFIPEGLQKLSIDAVNALGLDFGAVDIAFNEHYNQLRVFEVNTACGMDPGTTTHMRYVGAISKYLGIQFTKEQYCRKYNCELTNNLL